MAVVSPYSGVLRNLQFPDNHRIKTTKNVDSGKKFTFLGDLFDKPTGLSDKSLINRRQEKTVKGGETRTGA
jgi:hypothetical protein